MTFSQVFLNAASALTWTIGVVLPLFVLSFVLPLLTFVAVKIVKQSTQKQDTDFHQFSFLLMTSLFGTVLGFAVKLIGGFTVGATSGVASAVVAGIGTVFVAVFGIVASVFSETGTVSMRRPLGAVTFLIMFIVSGFFWKFLEKMPL